MHAMFDPKRVVPLSRFFCLIRLRSMVSVKVCAMGHGPEIPGLDDTAAVSYSAMALMIRRNDGIEPYRRVGAVSDGYLNHRASLELNSIVRISIMVSRESNSRIYTMAGQLESLHQDHPFQENRFRRVTQTRDEPSR